MNIHNNEIMAVINSSAAKRYSYFISKVVACDKMWGLYDDGWVMSETADGRRWLPFWPAKEYAAMCVAEEWEHCLPKAIDFYELLNVILPSLTIQNEIPGVFLIPKIGAIDISANNLNHDLREELAKYTFHN